MTKLTKSKEVAAEVAALIRARTPLIWVVTKEEARAESYLVQAAAAANYLTRMWDAGQGVTQPPYKTSAPFQSTEIESVLRSIGAYAKGPIAERTAWILRDLHKWLEGPMGITTNRLLRNLARDLPGVVPDKAQCIIVLTPSSEIPLELQSHVAVVEWPLPDRTEIGEILDAALQVMPEAFRETATPKNGEREAAIDAAVGLSGEEAQACYAKSLVMLRRVDPEVVAREKKRIIAKEGVLEWVDPIKGGLDAVGGLEELKAWLLQRKLAYTPAAKAYGLPPPKGSLLVGIPGCGKSLTAKAFPTALGVPLLKLDLGALQSKFVGESQQNIRKALRVIEAVGRCVVWMDEIEKALAGATQGAADGGVSSDALGTLLSWMQDRKGEAFVIATANDISKLPPELLRKGRWDELFFVDLPNSEERFAILQAALADNGRADHTIDVLTIGNACESFTGSEIAALVPAAMFKAFSDDAREITTADLLAEARRTVPLAKTASDRIEQLRSWAKANARSASRQPEIIEDVKPRGRVLDIA